MSKKELKGKIGLALGGGAALGPTHIGVLKAIEELGIEVACISGTSIGSLVAGMYAFNVNVDKVKNLALDFSWSTVTTISPSKYGLFSNSKLRDYIHDHIGEVSLENARIPIAIIATDISTGEKVVLKEGNAGDAIIASCCVPGIFRPVKIKNRLLVDGGIVENVPVSPLRELGAEHIIAVDLTHRTTAQPPKNIVDILLNSFHFTLAEASRLAGIQADTIIQPDLSDFSSTNPNQAEALIEKGYKESMKVLSGKAAD